MTIVGLNQFQAHLEILRGNPTGAAKLHAASAHLILDIERDAPLIYFASASVYLQLTLKRLHELVPLLDEHSKAELLRDILPLLQNWPSLYRTLEAEALYTIPSGILPGVNFEAPGHYITYDLDALSQILHWHVMPDILYVLKGLNATTSAASLLESIEHQRRLRDEMSARNFFSPLYISELIGIGYEGNHRVSLALLQLLQARLSHTTEATDLPVDPIMGIPFVITRMGESIRYASRATEDAYRKTVEELYSKHLADDFLLLDFTDANGPSSR